MKWLIIGTGWISESYVQSLKNNGESPEAILSRDLDKAKKFGKKNGIEKAYDNFNDAIGGIDNVYVATPNAYHYSYVKMAIENKKNVMVEKPMTISYKQTKELFKLAKKNKVVLKEAYAHITNDEMINLNMEGKECIANFMQLSSKVKAGTVETASTFNKDAGGGVINDLGVYPISLFVMKYGDMLETKVSNVKFLNGVEVECDIEIVFKEIVAKTRISKIQDGDNGIYVDGIKVLEHVSMGDKLNRMDAEVKNFKNQLLLFENISSETARIVEQLHHKIDHLNK